jgi:hypothetical protein
MPQKRPTSVVVLAIFQLLFGVLALLNYAVALSGAEKALAGLVPMKQAGQDQRGLDLQGIEQELEEKVANYVLIQKAFAGFGLILSLMMIASGIGLLKLHSWARTVAILYAALSILYTVSYFVWYFSVAPPVLSEYSRQLAATGGPDMQAAAQFLPALVMGGEACGGVSLVYPLLVLLVLCRRRVRAAFRGEPWPPEVEDVHGPYAADDVAEPGGDYGAGG